MIKKFNITFVKKIILIKIKFSDTICLHMILIYSFRPKNRYSLEDPALRGEMIASMKIG